VFRLCYKDYIASRWFWLLPFIIYFLYSIQPIGQTVMVMLFGWAAVFSCLFITGALEDRNKTEALYISLPVKRATVVRARYLLAGILTVVGGAAIFGLLGPINAFLKTRNPKADMGILMSVEGGAGFLAVVTFAWVLYLPLYFGLGFGRGSAIFSLVLLGLGLGLAGIGQLTARWLGWQGLLFTTETLKDPGSGIVQVLGRIRETTGTALFIGMIVAALVVLSFISLRLSERLYERREF
jgi:hypothetical protein